jgi:hypothetical protein
MLVSDFFLLFFSFFCSILMSSRTLKGNRFSLIALFKFSAPALFNGGAPKIDIARHFNVTRQTVYSLLKGVEV